jgi:hypothetical protein
LVYLQSSRAVNFLPALRATGHRVAPSRNKVDATAFARQKLNFLCLTTISLSLRLVAKPAMDADGTRPLAVNLAAAVKALPLLHPAARLVFRFPLGLLGLPALGMLFVVRSITALFLAAMSAKQE